MSDGMTGRTFRLLLARETSSLIAKKYHLSKKVALAMFKKSRVFTALMAVENNLDDKMPKDLLQLWRDEYQR